MQACEIYAAIHRWTRGAMVPEVSLAVPEYMEAAHGETVDPGVKPYRRIDALIFESLMRTAVEIKVSMADLGRESPYKWWGWSQVTHRFAYAIPVDLCDPVEVIRRTGNYSAGVWGVDADGRVTILRTAKKNPYPEPLPQRVVQNLAFRVHRQFDANAGVTELNDGGVE